MNGFVLSMVMLFLVQKKQIKPQSNPLQIFRTLINFLAKNDLLAKPLVIAPPAQNVPTLSREALETMMQQFDLVIVGPDQVVNVAARVSKNAYLELRAAARQALQALGSASNPISAFRTLFLTDAGFFVRFDQWISVRLPAHPNNRPTKRKKNSKREQRQTQCPCSVQWMDLAGDYGWHLGSMQYLLKVMQHALTDRVRYCRVLCPWESAEWSLKEKASSGASSVVVTVGLMLHEDNAFRIRDMGPDAEATAKCVRFRRFWGKRSQLRRFKDGTTCEAVIWDFSPALTHRVVAAILRYTTGRHMPSTEITSTAHMLDSFVRDPKSDFVPQTTAMLDAFKVLEQKLMALKGIPLGIDKVEAVCAESCYTALDAPSTWSTVVQAGRSKSTRRRDGTLLVVSPSPLSVMITLASSSKWPEDPNAIRVTKTAFFAKIAEQLAKQHKFKRCRTLSESLEISFKGFVFRLYMSQPRELELLRKLQAKNYKRLASVRQMRVHSKYKDSDFEALRRQYAKVNERDRQVPFHAAVTRGLALAHRFFSPVVRLAKRWVHAHLFSNHVRAEAVELLVASLFTAPAPFSKPCSAVAGFLRFLLLLAHFPFDRQPLLVDNVLSRFTTAHTRAIWKAFDWWKDQNAQKNISERQGMFVVGPLLPRPQRQSENINSIDWMADPHKLCIDALMWTAESSPSAVIVQRLASHARVSAEHLKGLLSSYEADELQWGRVFAPHTMHFDLLIHLKSVSSACELLFGQDRTTSNKRSKRNDGSQKYRNLQTPAQRAQSQKSWPPGFDPHQQFVRQLQKALKSFAIVFYDGLGKQLVGVVWKPQAFVPAPFKLNSCALTFPMTAAGFKEDKQSKRVNSMTHTSPNIFEITMLVQQLGGGLINDIELF